ncbi:hypothetical protein TMatcc_004948 [Talaromyces marneffei ATCC 18224]|uniref:Uncharacterized protein n=1 Tax=Talaromyces marneffei PM1 TaxID=1077442 RepID=A0A093XB40_TALMA|nr:uncharacterized protein EYB26_000134 [Talaromyces marneffei]KAE8557494.1 hypothetical protein EYB25_002201 [Talaromyces marneffei]QGA12490.1 hypothetical protein EYB26_000134 [Talaromyces marneffei]
MPDTHPIDPNAQPAPKLDGPGLSPSSTLSSDTSLSPPAPKSHHRRFLSLDNIEETSTRILTSIRSRSPLPRSSSPSSDKKRRRSPLPLQPSTSAASPPTSPAPPLSPSSIDKTYSPREMSPTSSHHSQRPGMGHRDVSSGTIDSSQRPRSDSYKRYSGTINHYGRHSNDWLFGGFSVRDTLRDGIEKLKGHNERDS